MTLDDLLDHLSCTEDEKTAIRAVIIASAEMLAARIVDSAHAIADGVTTSGNVMAHAIVYESITRNPRMGDPECN